MLTARANVPPVNERTTQHRNVALNTRHDKTLSKTDVTLEGINRALTPEVPYVDHMTTFATSMHMLSLIVNL